MIYLRDGIGVLIEALTIFHEYSKDSVASTHCTHDELRVMIDPERVSDEDKARLKDLSFEPDDDIGECFLSYRFGSA